MTEPDFSSCFVKFSRAEEHFVRYSIERQTWIDRNPYVLSREFDAETGRHSVVLNVVEQPRLGRWSLIAGDCIHNLRSALDHATYALAVRDSGKNPPPGADDIQFPTVRDPKWWPKAAERRLGCLSTASRARIESLQPYNRRHPDLLPLLSLMVHFDNIDKHRMLNITQSQLNRHSVRFEGRPNVTGATYEFGPINGRTKTLFSFFTNPPDPNVQYKSNPSVDIMIPLPAGPRGPAEATLQGLLEMLIAEVKSVIDQLIT